MPRGVQGTKPGLFRCILATEQDFCHQLIFGQLQLLFDIVDIIVQAVETLFLHQQQGIVLPTNGKQTVMDNQVRRLVLEVVVGDAPLAVISLNEPFVLIKRIKLRRHHFL